MNQLLITNLKQNTADFVSFYEPSIPYIPIEAKISKSRYIFFRVQFMLFVALFSTIGIYYFSYTKSLDEKERLSSNVMANYTLSNMYTDDINEISITGNNNKILRNN